MQNEPKSLPEGMGVPCLAGTPVRVSFRRFTYFIAMNELSFGI